MYYKPFGDLQLSYLGMGNMRLPTEGVGGPIDESKARAIVEYAYDHGVNYFDTAFRYHEGESELFTGKVLSQYPRETWNLATKLPGHMMRRENGKLLFTGFGEHRTESFDSIPHVFETQLERCGVEYFDFYLLHNLNESSFDFYNDEDLGVIEYVLSEKKAGRIKHLGFSSHARADAIDRFLTMWPGVFEYVQIQINYMDWLLQNAKSKYDVITKHGLPIIAMEPCRGGRLAALPGDSDARLKAVRPEDSVASWAFRYLQALPNIQVILSGMTAMEHVIENTALFSNPDPVTDKERDLLYNIVESLVGMIPCTDCRYCCEGCPQELEIPKLIAMYNEAKNDGFSGIRPALGAMGEDELPAACSACGACAGVCPQEIDVPDVMAKFAELLANPPSARS